MTLPDEALWKMADRGPQRSEDTQGGRQAKRAQAKRGGSRALEAEGRKGSGSGLSEAKPLAGRARGPRPEGSPTDMLCQIENLDRVRGALVWSLWMPGYDLAKDSPNRILGQHWSLRRRAGTAALKRVRAQALISRAPVGMALRGPCVVHVARVMPPRGRLLDADNAVAACKFLIDALVYIGVLVNDGPDVLPLPPVVHQHRKGAQGPGVLVAVYRLEEREAVEEPVDRPREAV